MKYVGHAQDQATGRESKTRQYGTYQAAHEAAEKLGKRNYVWANVYIYVTDETGDREV